MTRIGLQTEVNAPIERCFDISRSIDVHLQSMQHTGERAIAGRTSGLCEKGDVITWEARHFGIKQRLTVEITRLDYPTFFEDRMIKGAFKSMRHEHSFKDDGNKTIMRDAFSYEVPFGIIGRLFDKLILKDYMMKLLLKRNATIIGVAEGEG